MVGNNMPVRHTSWRGEGGRSRVSGGVKLMIRATSPPPPGFLHSRRHQVPRRYPRLQAQPQEPPAGGVAHHGLPVTPPGELPHGEVGGGEGGGVHMVREGGEGGCHMVRLNMSHSAVRILLHRIYTPQVVAFTPNTHTCPSSKPTTADVPFR